METLSKGSKLPDEALIPMPPLCEKASNTVSLAAGSGSENKPTLIVTSPADKPIARIEAMSISLPEFICYQ
jgi:hypothetical protein